MTTDDIVQLENLLSQYCDLAYLKSLVAPDLWQHNYQSAMFHALTKSKLFDEEFYLNLYPDIKNNNVSPILHYITYGFKENRTARFRSQFVNLQDESVQYKYINNTTSNAWDNINNNSSIYDDLNQFYAFARNKDRKTILHYLKQQIFANMNKDLNKLMMYLNEYELYHGDVNFINKIETMVADSYYQMCYQINENCLLFNPIADNTQIASLKNKFRGERAFIIGNGPSLNKLDMTRLKNEITFGVNGIFLAKDKFGFEPTFYCVEDTHVAHERPQEIYEVNSYMKFFGYYLKDTILFHPNNCLLNVILDYRRYFGFPFFSTDASKRLWVGGTVSYLNMQLAYYMGFAKVYLVGFDHNYTIPQSAQVSGWNVLSTEDDPNHFDGQYFGKGYQWHLPCLNRMELCYVKAKHAFELDDRQIINCTCGGKLEIFERQAFEDVLDKPYNSASVHHIIEALLIEQEKQRSQILISAIVPIYNVEQYLARCLDSILAQTFRNYEIIIVNDGSQDNSLLIAEEYQKKYPAFIKIISQENKGLGGARNTGIAHATGKYCIFIDSDDTVEPDMFKILYQKAESDHYDIVQCGYRRIDTKNQTVQPVYASANYCGLNAIYALSKGGSFMAACRLYNLDFVRKTHVAFLNHIYHEDIEWTFKLYYYAKKTAIVDHYLYNWYIRNGSITSHINKKHIYDLSLILSRIKIFFYEENLLDVFSKIWISLFYRVFNLALTRIEKLDNLSEKTLLLHCLKSEMAKFDLDHHKNMCIDQTKLQNEQKSLLNHELDEKSIYAKSLHVDGMLYFKNKNYDSAIVKFNQAFMLDNDYLYLYRLAYTYLQMGNFTLAKMIFPHCYDKIKDLSLWLDVCDKLCDVFSDVEIQQLYNVIIEYSNDISDLANYYKILEYCLSAPMQKYDHNEIYKYINYLYKKSNHKKLFIVCTSRGPNKYQHTNILKEFDVDFLFIRDVQDAWYNKGFKYLTQNIDETIIYLKDHIIQNNYEKIYTLGSSSGGYASILFGNLLHANAIIAFSPQTLIPCSYMDIDFELLKNVDDKYFDLKKFVSNNIPTHIFYDEDMPGDKQNALYIADVNNVHLHPYHYNNQHNIVPFLIKNGDYHKFIQLYFINV